jgi:hypothetical protein
VIAAHHLLALRLRIGWNCRLRLKRDGTRAKTRFRLSAKRTRPFKSAGESVQSTTGSRGVRISGNNVGYTMFRGSVKSTEYPLNSPVSPSLPLLCVTVCHHVSTGLCFRLPSVVLWACHETTFTFSVYRSSRFSCQTSRDNGFQASFITWLSLTGTNHISFVWMRFDRIFKNKLSYPRSVKATREEQDKTGV